MSTTYDLISKVTIPNSGGTNVTYEIKDAWARERISDLGDVMNFLGVSDTVITDGSTTNPIQIRDGSTTRTVTAQRGDVIIYDQKEFVWNGSSWSEFGDIGAITETNYAIVSTTIPRTEYTVGSGTNNITITASATSAMGSNATFTTSVTPTTKKLSTGNVIGVQSSTTTASKANKSTAVESLTVNTTASDGKPFIESLTTTNKLVTTSVTGISGSEDKAASLTLNSTASGGASITTSSTTKKLTTTKVPNVTGGSNTKLVVDTFTPKTGVSTQRLAVTTLKGVSGTDSVHDTPTLNKKKLTTSTASKVVTTTPSGKVWGDYTNTSNDRERLEIKIDWGNVKDVTSNTDVTVATGALSETSVTTNVGAEIGISLTAGTSKTFATANAEATTLATGSLTSDGTGASVATGLTDGSAITFATGSVDTNASGASVTTGITFGTEITVATGQLSATTATANVGAEIVESTSNQYLHASTTIPTVDADATTVATGAVASDGGGATVITGGTTKYIHTSDVTFSDVTVPIKNASQSTFVTGISDTAPGTGETGVVTEIASASTSIDNAHAVNAVTDITKITLPAQTGTEAGDGHKHTIGSQS